jgi:hypothetical protein
VVLWSALPAEIRALTRPIAARDYWKATPFRRYLTSRVFKAVLIERGTIAKAKNPADSHFIERSLIEDLAVASAKQIPSFFSRKAPGAAGKKSANFVREFIILPCGGRMSAIKRDIGIKDFAVAIEGHGASWTASIPCVSPRQFFSTWCATPSYPSNSAAAN